MDGQKITGPIKTSLEAHWRRAEAKRFFDFKHIIHSPDFDLICWEGMRNAIGSYPKMFRIFVTKQVSGWYGSNSKQSLWDTSINNVCPNCGLSRDTLKHLAQCSDKGHVTPFRESIKDVICCLERANIDVLLITIIKDYIIHQGLVTMESCTPPGIKFTALARVQNWLGWDYFVEGRIPTLLIETVQPFLHDLSPQKSMMTWGISFLKALLGVIHKRWLLRNADVHHRIDGLTTHQHTLLNQRIHNLIQTTPKELLPMHCHLLQQDFAQLGNAETLQ
jgi:hypothetical protein